MPGCTITGMAMGVSILTSIGAHRGLDNNLHHPSRGILGPSSIAKLDRMLTRRPSSNRRRYKFAKGFGIHIPYRAYANPNEALPCQSLHFAELLGMACFELTYYPARCTGLYVCTLEVGPEWAGANSGNASMSLLIAYQLPNTYISPRTIHGLCIPSRTILCPSMSYQELSAILDFSV